MRRNFSGFAHILLLIVVVLGIGVIGFLATQNQQIEILPNLETTNSPTPTNTETNPISSPSSESKNYNPSAEWTTLKHPGLGITLCLPPKWEFSNNGDGTLSANLIYSRDSQYAPNIAYFESIPYSEGSRREAYFDYWEGEYSDVRESVTFNEVEINGNTVLIITSADSTSTNYVPDGNLAALWYSGNKLWKTGLSGWEMINSSKSAFLNDFYTMISCSF